jgi:hypothetical protein
VPELARRERSECHELLERGHLRRVKAQLPRARGTLILPRKLHPLKELTNPELSYWLCTHWLRSRKMPRVTPEERFAANLRRQRLAKGLSQEALAERTGLHPSEVSRLERAVREPRLGTIARLARGLGVSAEKLVAGIR